MLYQGNRRAGNARGGDHRFNRLIGPRGRCVIERAGRLAHQHQGSEQTGQKGTSSDEMSSAHGWQGIKSGEGRRGPHGWAVVGQAARRVTGAVTKWTLTSGLAFRGRQAILKRS